MDNHALREQIWEDFTEAQLYYRYYQELYERYQRWRITVRVTMLVSVLAVGSPIYGSLPDQVGALVSGTSAIVAAIAILIDFALDPTKKSIVSFTLSRDCGNLVEDYRQLWLNLENEMIEERAAFSQFRDLADRVASVTRRSADAGITTIPSVLNRTTDDAHRIMKDQYGEEAA